MTDTSVTDNSIQRAVAAIQQLCGMAIEATGDPTDSNYEENYARAATACVSAEFLARAIQRALRGEGTYNLLAEALSASDLRYWADRAADDRCYWAAEAAKALRAWADLASAWPCPEDEEDRHRRHCGLAALHAQATAERITERGMVTPEDSAAAARAALMFPGLSDDAHARLANLALLDDDDGGAP